MGRDKSRQQGANHATDTHTLNTGGPSEDPCSTKSKQSEIAWIPAFDIKQLKMFFFLWRMGAPIYYRWAIHMIMYIQTYALLEVFIIVLYIT